MSLVLYRKYRPKTFSEIIGQEHVVQTLKNAILSGMISHAYLFHGPKGSGKTTIARLLAKAVNCQNRQGFEPCNNCSSCLDINESRALDLIEIDAASHRGIDEIRELRDGIRFVPTKSKYKVFVIDECLTGDHLISMADGTVKKISEIKNGEKTLSVNIETGEIVVKPISNWFKRKTEKVVKIKTPQSFLTVTPTHRLWILRDSQFLLKEASDLKIGDFLLSPVYLPHLPKNDLTPNQLALLAMIQCDGHVSKDSITTQIEIRKDRNYFIRTFKKGIKAWKIKEKPVIKRTARGTTLIRIYSRKLKNILISLDCPQGKKGNKIDIPIKVFQAPLENIRAFIDTCFSCEGDIDSSYYRLNLNSTSRIFVQKLQLILKKFGISSSIQEIPKHKKNHSNQYRLTLSHYNLQIFEKKIGLSLKRKASLLVACATKKARQDSIPIERIIVEKQKEIKLPYSLRASLGIYPDLRQHPTRKSVLNFIKVGGLIELNRYLRFHYEKVMEIKIINKKETVYDFTVKGTHTFITNGICSSNCHQLTKEAANALLKTLEEPPSHAIFILATTEIHKMISTIVSRCQRFDFRRLTVPEIVKKLEWISEKEKIKIEKPALELIALNSSGSFRDAEGLLDQALAFSGTLGREKEIKTEDIKNLLGLVEINLIQDFVDFICHKEAAKTIKFLNEKIDQGLDLQEFSRALINYLRQALILKTVGVGDNKNPIISGLTKEEFQKLQSQTENFNEPKIHRILQLFLEAEQKMKYSPIQQLPLELAIIEILQPNV